MLPKRSQSLWLSLVLTCQVALFGIVFFCRGFLLQKVSTPDTNNLPTYHGKPMWGQVVLFIIDAMKYDFMSHTGLNEIYTFSKQNTSHSRLYNFVADPPTTTLQRLKSMTTGTFPTFIEAAFNFGGAEIKEDNIIDQLLRQKSSIVQMGDDTWDSIFPRRFMRTYPYPSFDVWDLDTVDKGVERHIFKELKENDWKLLIAHCLGVDHAGHRYSPNHQEMERKLKEMDILVRRVMDNLPDNSLLLVFGDHGMTSTGDHGGDTKDEVDAALFAYSNSHPFTNDTNGKIPQVNLVPTLSTILGIPIPFSNIGQVVKGLLPLSPKDSLYSLALHQNIAQVRQYLDNLYGHVDFEDLIFINQLTVVLLVGYRLPSSVVSCLLAYKLWYVGGESGSDLILLVLLSWHGFFLDFSLCSVLR
ncbi:GPI ethanolamine phosphate transferase 3-like [Artemia franciscana]|uniref:GPI ethanolamine phosphate transferase 3-like n=1 Tax=Artemia franciscana TaxID=6661 RepID=UPI0032DAD163